MSKLLQVKICCYPICTPSPDLLTKHNLRNQERPRVAEVTVLGSVYLTSEWQTVTTEVLAHFPWHQCDLRDWPNLLVMQSVEKCVFSHKKIGGIKRHPWSSKRKPVLGIRNCRFGFNGTIYKLCGLGQVTTTALRLGLFITQEATSSWPWLPGRWQCRSIKQWMQGWFMDCMMML